MHVLKPQSLGFSCRPVEYRHRTGLSISGYLHIPFDQGPRGRLWTEQSMWDFLAQEMSSPIIDEGVRKLTPEFLVHGNAYTTPERKDAVAARAELAGLSKTVFVFGDRYWTKANAATAPLAFDSKPIDWASAYGGEGYAPNPGGKGRAVVDGVHWLPNIELPQSRLLRNDQEVVPAGFGALEVMHPQRVGLQGTYDEAWMKEHSPAIAPDTDWKYFNLAPRDQWLPDRLRGDEAFTLENLHPTRAVIKGQLPGFKVRMFVNMRLAGETGQFKFREVANDLTTVWFFPHAERMILIFQGLAECEEDDAFDVAHLMGAVERIDGDPARDDAHYLKVFEKRTDMGPAGALQYLNEVDLVPPGIGLDDPATEQAQAPLAIEGFREAAEYRKATADITLARERARAHGKDPDAMGLTVPEPPSKPTPEEMPAYIEQLIEQMEQQQWAAVEDLVSTAEKVVALKREGKLDQAQEDSRGPPRFRAKQQLDEIEARYRKVGLPFDRSQHEPTLVQAEMVQHAEYQQSAHLQPPARPLTGQARSDRREEIEWLLDNGHTRLTMINLTGADLSGLDLRGLDLSGAWLESCNLSHANLSRAKLAGAVLAHADLSGCVAVSTDFSGANLGGAKIYHAVLDNADLTGTILMRTKLSHSSLRGALMLAANLLESRWTEMELGGIHAPEQLFHELDLSSCRFVGAQLAGANFVECVMEGADFSEARLQGANFLTCSGARAKFIAADLSGAVFAAGGDFSKADLMSARMENSNFGDSNFSGARLTQAVINGCNATRARLARVDARSVSATSALLRKADLRGSNWQGSNFKDAILSGADARGTNLGGAHFFGADLTRIRLDRSSILDSAMFERARIYPRRRPRASDAVT